MGKSCLNCSGIPDGSYITSVPWGKILASWKVGWLWIPQACCAARDLPQDAGVQQMVLKMCAANVLNLSAMAEKSSLSRNGLRKLRRSIRLA